ncbi:MAG: hypothetical protein OEV95_02005 [Gemmatimonadota bacterium]|nr:hypothetical protein [Gemmatimonadota bacterium]
MTNHPWHAGVLGFALAGCAPPEPPLQLEVLVPALDTVVTPYLDVTDAIPLAAGRWVVIAPQEPAVATVDTRSGGTRRFGGRQAGELEQPFHLFRSGDTIYIADWQRRRLTLWSLGETLIGALTAPDGLRGALPRARDQGGNWYFELRTPPGPEGRGNLDSASIVRVRADWAAADTIARLAPLDLAEVISDGRVRLERRLLSGQDRWGVLSNGTVWVARVGANQVEWRDPAGAWRRGLQLPDRVLPITENDRQLFLRRFDASLRPTVEQIPFSAIKPPFENAVTGRDGLVWLVKSRAVGDTVREYQVVDSTSRLVRYLAHPGIGRLVGLGDGELLVAEPFEQGVRLLVFPIVPASAPSKEMTP